MFKQAITAALLTSGALFAPISAAAQEKPFTGPSVGVETGYLEHHFALGFEERNASGELIASYDRYYRSHGVGGGIFGGYDLAISRRGRVGAELAASAGGRDNRFGTDASGLTLSPRFGVKGAVRVGYLLTPRLMGYALTGYGGNAYRVRDTVGIERSEELRWGSSFIVGAGAEYRLNRRIGLRLDGKHVDNQTWQLFAGVPIRF